MQASEAKLETRLPRAVLRKSAELKEKFGGPVNGTEPKPAPAVTETPPADPPNAVVTANPAEPPAPTPEGDPRENDLNYWKQRFNVTAGVLRVERDDRKVQMAALNQRVTELTEEINTLRAAKAADAPIDLGQFYTPEQIEEMGEEVAAAQIKAVLKTVRAELKSAFDAEVKPLREARETRAADEAQDRRTRFLDKLAELVPDYPEIDVPGPFHEWLASPNDDGIVRQEILDRHVGAFNAEGVARMFQAYKALSKRPVPQVSPNGSGAAPSGALPRSDASLTPPSPAEIKEYYKLAAMNKVTKEQKARFEARLKLITG